MAGNASGSGTNGNTVILVRGTGADMYWCVTNDDTLRGKLGAGWRVASPQEAQQLERQGGMPFTGIASQVYGSVTTGAKGAHAPPPD